VTSTEPAPAPSPDVAPAAEPAPASSGDDGRPESRATDDETQVPGPQDSPDEPDETDRALIAQLEASAPAEFFDQEAADEPKKRRWSLFKKGGDR